MTLQPTPIWRTTPTLEQLNSAHPDTLVELLGIEFTAIGPDSIEGCMPVDARTRQPFGILHGGASVALAETLGSVGASLTIDLTQSLVVGQEINANHLRSVREGQVFGLARPLHLGGRSQVWSIEIRDDQRRLVCVSRLTLAVIDRKRPA
ncbi:MAG: hotdog fold thioesterase [Steroidobacteraceae bacterium]